MNSYLGKAWLTLQAGLSCLPLHVSVKPNEGVLTAPANDYFMMVMLWWAGFRVSEFCYCSSFAWVVSSQTTLVFAAGSPSSHAWQHPWASSLSHDIQIFLWLSLHLCCDFYFETWLTWQWPCWCKKSRGGLAWRTENSSEEARLIAGGWAVTCTCQNFVNMSPNKKPALFFKQVFFFFTAQYIISQKSVWPGRAVYYFTSSFYYIKLCNIHMCLIVYSVVTVSKSVFWCHLRTFTPHYLSLKKDPCRSLLA